MRKTRTLVALTLMAAVGSSTISGCSSAQKDVGSLASTSSPKYTQAVTISALVDSDAQNSYGDAWKAVAGKMLEKYNIKVEFENKPNSTEGDNLVKTRLAAGEMDDILYFNTGAQFVALNPTNYFVDLSGKDFIKRLDKTYTDCATVDGKIYGVPGSSSTAGGIVYNKAIYQKLGLKIPKTWKDFLANCNTAKSAGYDAILGTYKDDWTSQYAFLSDNFNVLAQDPNFPKNFENSKEKFETTSIALRSWQKLNDTSKYMNKDYLSTNLADGINMMIKGKAIHWFMTSQIFSYIAKSSNKATANNFGFFAEPGDSANSNGATEWLPSSWYVTKDSQHQDAAVKFLEYYISDEGMNIFKQHCSADGPYLIKGVSVPSDSYDGVKDLQAYADAGHIALALEFQTPLKGASAAQICTECGSGAKSAKECAALYDDDCKKEAVQLGLKNWN